MNDLQDIRSEIDEIDRHILELLAKRFACSEKIAAQKIKQGLPVYDGAREEMLFENIKNSAKSKGIPTNIAESIFQEIVHQSRRLQESKLREK